MCSLPTHRQVYSTVSFCALVYKLDNLLLRTEFAANRDDFDIRERTPAIFGKNGWCGDDGIDLLGTISVCRLFKYGDGLPHSG
jgi:hypothetical protein